MAGFKMSLIFCLATLYLTSQTSATPINSTRDVQVTVAPHQVHEGFTRDMLLNCSFMHGQNSDFSNVMSIIVTKVSHQLGQPDQELASIASVDPHNVVVKNNLGAQVSGRLVHRGLSFISFTWKYPPKQVMGEFKCEAFGIDNSGHPRTSQDMTEVSELTVDIGAIVSKINALEKTQDDIKGRIDDSRSAMIASTTLYRGHSYLLSYPIWRNVRFADSLCRLYGGYLVEIDDQEELTFVRQLAKDNKVAALIVGANDEKEEGKWIFFKSGGQMTSFHGQSAIGGGNTGLDCMAIRGDATDDMDCTAEDWNNFLCEMS